MADRITWEKDISGLFTQGDIGCMGARGLNLGDYASVKAVIGSIIDRVANGSMPLGGPKWDEDKVKLLRDWEAQGCPER